MRHPTRRGFIQTAGATTLAWSLAERLPAQIPVGEGTKSRTRLPRGYLFVQDLETDHPFRHGAISAAAEADQFFSALKAAPEGALVNALEFNSSLDEPGLQTHKAVARVGLAHGVDLWATTWRLTDRIHAFSAIRPEF